MSRVDDEDLSVDCLEPGNPLQRFGRLCLAESSFAHEFNKGFDIRARSPQSAGVCGHDAVLVFRRSVGGTLSFSGSFPIGGTRIGQGMTRWAPKERLLWTRVRDFCLE